MGLIKAAIGAAGGVLADQWREFFYCDSLDETVLVTKGEKRTGGRSSNKKGEDNIISNGSVIAVADGQCMIIVDQGKVAEICAEPGEFIYDTSSEPSVFYGSLGENIKRSFAEFGKRFGFGGDTGKDQRVYYINTKEIYGNKYGTPNPVPFRVVDANIGLDIDISVRCHGEYSYKISDPVLFYTNVCGNVEGDFYRDEIDSQLKTELLTALQPAFAKISQMGVRYSALPGHTTELSGILNEELTEQWKKRRGIEIVSFGVSSVNASEEDEKMIKELQRNAAFRNPSMAAAHLVGSQARAMQDAAKNQGGMGAMGGFFGMNMAQNAAGANAEKLFAMGSDKQKSDGGSTSTEKESWKCSCGNIASGKFCPECGSPKPAAQTGWKCSCGTVNKGKFCTECGKPKPAGALLYKCDKCGWEPEDPANPPKFCPECGDAFDSNDVK